MAERAIEWFGRTELPSNAMVTVRRSLIAALTLLNRSSESYEMAERLVASDPDRWLFQGDLGVEAAPRVRELTYAPPAGRQRGIMVDDVAGLVAALQDKGLV